MTKKDIHFSMEVYNSADELQAADKALLDEARKVTATAYAPYSNFLVGAVAQLANGKTVSGTNQENASYPVGICAERTLLSAVAALYPGEVIETMAISYNNTKGQSNNPASPCGICRQTLTEYEDRTNHSIRLILSGQSGQVQVIETARHLLPLSFGADDLLA